uniref:Coat protein n=1 Tax=Erysiphales associated totivirus 16 TaxID=2719845 RepID=A0A6G9EN21_9VIRU|nr:coat protein [Erysiphales associated totivirus 16]
MLFSNYFNTNAVFKTIKKGCFAMTNHVALNVSGVEKAGYGHEAYDRERTKGSTVGSAKLWDNLAAASNEFGFQVNNRPSVEIISKATVYGCKGHWSCGGMSHTPSGLRPEAVDVSGTVSHEWLKNKVRELNVMEENREARLNLFTTTWLTQACYDNATALLVRLYQMYMTCRVYELTPTRTVRYTFSLAEAAEKTQGEKQALTDYIRAGLSALVPGGINFERNTDLLHREYFKVAQQVKKYAGELGPKETDAKLSVSIEVFECYSYDDGHSRSGTTFGDVYGFASNVAPVPLKANFLHDMGERRLVRAQYIDMHDAESMRDFEQAAGHVNVGGMSRVEAEILDRALSDNTRQSPLLIDQDFSILPANKKVFAYNMISEDIGRVADINSSMVLSTIEKLVHNHNWYEDARSAYLMVKYWAAQPATDSVESHWWATLDRQMVVPKLGLGRAAIPGLIGPLGVGVTKQALAEGQRLFAADDSLLVTSFISNTLWYWGEYLNLINAPNTKELANRLRMGVRPTSEYTRRPEMMISAVLGEAVDSPSSEGCYTSLDGDLKSQVNHRVMFGEISSESIAKRGYKKQSTHVTFGQYVQPGALGLIIGLGGSLIKDTPYSSAFAVSNASLSEVAWREELAYSYNDIWALGVVARWTGHEVKYMLPGERETSRTLYAVNDNSVAMPPIYPTQAKMRGLYTIVEISRRRRQYATNLAAKHEYIRHFVWQRTVPTAIEGVKIGGRKLAVPLLSGSKPIVLEAAELTPDEKTYYVKADYDVYQSDFRVSRMRTAILLPDAIPTSESLATELNEQPMADPPYQGE